MKKKFIILVILFMILLTVVLELPKIESNLNHTSGETSSVTNVVRPFHKQ